MFAFSCGVILLYRFSVLPPYPWLFLSLFVLLTFFIAKATRFRVVVLLLIAWVFGLGWAAWHADAHLQQRLSPLQEGVPLTVAGYVCDLPQPGSFNSIRFSFCVESWPESIDLPDGGAHPEKIRVAWYGSGEKVLPSGAILLEVVLKRPHGNLNDAGFRYEDWLFRHGVRATGSVRGVAKLTNGACGLVCSYHAWHRKMATVVEGYFGGAAQYPLLASLLIGNRGHLTGIHWQTLKATGTIHLVAISGLHLGLVALAAGLLCRRFLLLLPSGWLSEKNLRKTVYCTVILASLFYALVAGMTVPTRRALVMVVVGGWFLLKARDVSPWRPFVIALTCVLVFDPSAPLDQGFWLSFLAVALLVWVFSGRLRRVGWLAGLMLAQCAVFVGLWPVLQAFDQTQPLVGVVANLVAIPWVSFVVMPVLFAGAVLVFITGDMVVGHVIAVFDAVLGVLWYLLQSVEAIPFDPLPRLTQAALVALALVILLVLRFPDRLFRAVSIIVLLGWVGLGWRSPEPPVNPAVKMPEVRIWDVGQGLSVLVRSGRKVLLYDTGPEVKGVYSAVESVLLPNLRALGVKHIEHLVVSHGDSDHSGGLSALLNEVSLGAISSGEPVLVGEKLARHPAPLIQDCPRMTQTFGEFELSFWRSSSGVSGNDASCVLRLFHPKLNVDLLLTGDISRSVEAEMLADPRLGWLSAFSGRRILVAPHHGSKTSSSTEWVAGVAPDWVIYTAGYQHRYGHPHEDVVERYQKTGAVPLNTACSGQLSVRFGPESLNIVEAKQQAPFWIAGPGLARDQCKIP
ncbi:DNA internalization-related competence protein ComEC/Rec2 [Marinobacter litoralis]|uniref:DNA internalization-related competence protein ComEC/Rec2 n=1 Tax=Marinobacter litoralis TaxID=187981 RepID=UPI0018EDA042|nr:DNA internalization-related competence protein ComEC/Rec2 [Marinobacter litoralis]MBJ6137617.1 DNA internalization-related competence protein ComEC/Rec2 [Marinobacter litoralis]